MFFSLFVIVVVFCFLLVDVVIFIDNKMHKNKLDIREDKINKIIK